MVALRHTVFRNARSRPTLASGNVTRVMALLVIPGYTASMKTAISLPDDLFASAEALAKRLGMSRSGLVAAALAEFVAKHRASRISERLDAVYSTEDSRLDATLAGAQRKGLARSDW
jgi:hypothetical protein